MRFIRVLFLAPLVFLLGCQSATTPTAKTVTIEWTGWFVQNVPSDWWASGATTPSLMYEFSAGMSKNTLASDVASFDIYLPGSKAGLWSFEPTYFDEASHSWGIKNTNANWSDDKAALPLGTMDVVMNLSDGRKLTSSIVATQPGSTSPGPTVVANEDSVAFYANKVSALPRPVVTSATRDATASTLNVQFTETDPAARAYNGWVWLYDGAGNYLGGFFYFRPRATPHTPVPELNGGVKIKTDGSANLLVVPLGSLVTDSGATFTTTQFASVASVRVVVCDGGQYAANTGIYYDYRSISKLQPVN